MKLFKNIAASFALIIILFSGCKNPAEDVQIVVNTDIFKSPTLIQFVNAKKGIEGPQDFTVNIIGPNADLVRTTTGSKTFKASSGLLNLVLDRSANPSAANPVKFTVIANATGFAPIFKDVVITSANEPTFYQVTVAEYANPATGTGAIVDTKAISNGTTSTDISITTPTNSGITQQTSISVPTGTGLLDAAGVSVGGGTLESRIAFNGTATNGTTPVVPGGNVAKNVIGANGQAITGGVTFIPAGSVSIDMFSGGKEVKTFTKPVTVDMELSATMINPTTNTTVKAGETIPMWSLNDETGQWKNEGNATLVLNGSSKLVARMQITHLSAWSAAWQAQSSDFCPTTFVINKPAATFTEKFIVASAEDIITFLPGETTKTVVLVSHRLAAGNAFVRPYVTSEGNQLYVNNNVSNAYLSNTCNATSTFTFVAASNVINADVNIKVKCGGKDLLTGVNALITITPIGGTSDDTRIYNLTQGRGSGQVIDGVTYKIVAAVDGKSYTSQFTASKTNFQLPTGLDLVGTASFVDGRLKIDGLVTKTDCN